MRRKLRIDRKSALIMAAIAGAPVYGKRCVVEARRAEEGESITTVSGNGGVETVNVARAGDWVVTNPGGEQYNIGQGKFEKRYRATGDLGRFRAVGYCRAIENPYGEGIEILAEWGEKQFGDERCMIADTCDEEGGNLGGEPYLIEGEAFEETYGEV